jgi:AIG2-like family
VVTGKLWTFFYGSFMNPAVLREAGLEPPPFEVGRLDGYDITIGPLANLVESEGATTYGLLAQMSHGELRQLYDHAEKVLGGNYEPHPALVQTRDGRWRAALCYIAPAMEHRPADRAYVERILKPAREHGFPARYLARLEQFL